MNNMSIVMKISCFLAIVPTLVLSVAPTDSLQDADPAQSGYLPNHNLHPATVGSAIFGQLWKNNYNDKEDWYAKPLVLTPAATGREVVFIASNQNIIRIIDGLNGTLINSRTIQPPFLQSDIGCGDIPNFIGIIGTPIIDPGTETVYFFSKGYKNGASSGGVLNGRYSLYAVDFNTLQDKPGFPVLIDGNFADNDPTRYFLGGTVLQRPSLTQLNGAIIGAFGGHCDLFNYTGMVVGVSKTPGVGVTGIYAMEAAPGAPTPQPLDYSDESGGKAGIWQSGMGLATDASRIFFNTGNGKGHQNGDVPASGRSPLSTLDETVVNMQVLPNGTFSLTDYFEPFEYVNMDAADKDLGSSGVSLLDPTVFVAAGISRIAVTVGKNGKCYIMDANQLGGFKQGPSGTDGTLQTISATNAVFGGVGSYPLEGGYIYFTPVGQPTVCYKYTVDGTGRPSFVSVGQSKVPSAGRVGVGVPTITTYKGQTGTGIVWITDVNLGLRAFKALPEGGVLVPINLPALPGLGKFGRPGFGNGRVFVTTRGTVWCLGAPVALPLACSQVDFGGVAIGTIATVNVNCTTQIALAKINGCTTQDKTFQCLNSTLPVGPLAKGVTFTFPVIWNLTQASINDAQNASYGHVLPGVQSTVLDIYTTNKVAGYSNNLPISMGGTTISKSAFLAIAPQEVDFGGIVVNSPSATSGLEDAIIISNLGSQALVLTGFSWEDGFEGSTPHNLTTSSDGSKVIGTGFTSSSFPVVGYSIVIDGSITIPFLFKTNTVGSYSSILTVYSNGGSRDVLLVGSASTTPIANISVSTSEVGWDNQEPLLMDFGDVLAGKTVVKSIRLCNQGGSSMTVTKSKPPTQPELTASNPNTDLHEGQSIPINTCALGPVKIIAAFSGPNRPSHIVSDVWVLNVDGLNPNLTPFGVHDVAITANIVTRQVGPLLSNGTARYQYLGCYADGSGRQLASKLSYSNSQQNANENGQCQKDCFARGYVFAGTEYHNECWCGNTPPSPTKLTPDSARYCAFSCPGDTSQACGGAGTYLSAYYDVTRYTPSTESAVSRSVVSSSTSSFLISSSSSFVATSSSTAVLISSSSISSSVSTSTSSTSKVLSSVGSSSSSDSAIASSTTSSTNSSSTSSAKNNIPISSTSTPSSALSSTKSTSTISSTPSQTAGLGTFIYLGCYFEPVSGSRALKLTLSSSSMTNEMCAGLCAGSSFFGTEYGKECYCGNSLTSGAVSAPATDCKIACAGNSKQICGGSLRLSVYKNSTSASNLSSSSSSSKTTTSVVSDSSTLLLSASSVAVNLSFSSISSSIVLSSTTSSVFPNSPSSISSSTFSSISGFNYAKISEFDATFTTPASFESTSSLSSSSIFSFASQSATVTTTSQDISLTSSGVAVSVISTMSDSVFEVSDTSTAISSPTVSSESSNLGLSQSSVLSSADNFSGNFNYNGTSTTTVGFNSTSTKTARFDTISMETEMISAATATNATLGEMRRGYERARDW